MIGLIGAVSGRNALRQVESERLIELREGQKRAVQALFREVTNSLIVWSGGFTINEATAALTTGFAQLANATITPAQQQQLVNYYDNQMLKPIKHATGDSIDINAVLPNSNAQKYVQAYYTAAPRPTPTRCRCRTPGTAAHGRRPTPASISTSATSPPASTTATRCCSTRRATSSTAS